MTSLPEQGHFGYYRRNREGLNVDERVQLYDEAAYALAGELALMLGSRYTAIAHSDGHGETTEGSSFGSSSAGISSGVSTPNNG
jgi:hypothetical protein